MLREILSRHFFSSTEKRIIVPFLLTNQHGLFSIEKEGLSMLYNPFYEVKGAIISTEEAKEHARLCLNNEVFRKSFADPASMIEKAVKHHNFQIEGIKYDAVYIPFNDCTGQIQWSHSSHLRLLPIGSPDFKKQTIVRNQAVEHPFSLRSKHIAAALKIIWENKPHVQNGW